MWIWIIWIYRQYVLQISIYKYKFDVVVLVIPCQPSEAKRNIWIYITKAIANSSALFPCELWQRFLLLCPWIPGSPHLTKLQQIDIKTSADKVLDSRTFFHWSLTLTISTINDMQIWSCTTWYLMHATAVCILLNHRRTSDRSKPAGKLPFGRYKKEVEPAVHYSWFCSVCSCTTQCKLIKHPKISVNISRPGTSTSQPASTPITHTWPAHMQAKLQLLVPPVEC